VTKPGIILTACLFAGCFSSTMAAQQGKFSNGVSLHGPLTWGRTTPDRTGYLTPVYADPKYAVPVELLRKVKAAGFDFVRLSVDPGPLLALTGRDRDDLDDYCLGVVKTIRGTGLDVVFDFHPISMVKPYGRTSIMTSAGDKLFGVYVDMVRRFARLLAPLDPGHIALEPMNEPAIGNEPAAVIRWQGMMDRLYDAVRAESHDMPVVVTGGCGGGLDGLCLLNAKHYDGNTLYSFHYYLPYVFSHAGVSPPLTVQTFSSGLPYPAQAAGFNSFWTVLEERVGKNPKVKPAEKDEILTKGRKRIENYFSTEGNRAFIAAKFDKVTEWAKKNGVPPTQIFLGEFGVTQKCATHARGTLPDDRARWLTDVRQEAEQRGFHWALWALSGESASGMVLVDPGKPDRIDPLTAQALGKTPGK
jgi:hypothetical protein